MSFTFLFRFFPFFLFSFFSFIREYSEAVRTAVGYEQNVLPRNITHYKLKVRENA